MVEAEKIAMVETLSGETNETLISSYLAIAGNKICRKAYPFDPTVREVPEQYGYTQVEIAVYLLSRRGYEGQTGHSENGYSDSYESGDVPPELMRQIVPMAAVL